ncbi:MAG: hypothetical protein LM583_10290 [Desulfurococcaceae archaeon]|nr:hypothetical protein [Desulfurococcaceae archaeon]
MCNYTPEIHIFEDRIEVFAYGIRRSNPHTTRTIWENCVHSQSIIPYICQRDLEVLQHLLYILRSRGCTSVKICRYSGKNTACREVSLE